MARGVILLVEDNPDDAELEMRALAESYAQHEIIWAPDGEEALDYLSAAGKYAGRDPTEKLAATLIDLRLPKVDGYELLRRIRSSAATRHVPVFIFTGSDQEADLVKAYDLGCNCFARKPTRFTGFVELLRHMDWLAIDPPGSQEQAGC